MSQPRRTATDIHGHVPALYDVGVSGDGVDDGRPGMKMDALFTFPHKGYAEDIRLRVFPIDHPAFDVFISADRMRAALDAVAPRSGS